jgi:hypothetical protein
MEEVKFGTSKQNTIPMSRVRTIMKSSPDVTIIKEDTLYSVCRATVSFQPFKIEYKLRVVT